MPACPRMMGVLLAFLGLVLRVPGLLWPGPRGAVPGARQRHPQGAGRESPVGRRRPRVQGHGEIHRQACPHAQLGPWAWAGGGLSGGVPGAAGGGVPVGGGRSPRF